MNKYPDPTVRAWSQASGGALHEAKLAGAPSIDTWGSGHQCRQFVYVGDLAWACLFAMRHCDDRRTLNLGCGRDMSIRDLAFAVKRTVGLAGDLHFDASRPDGMPRKALDASVLLGRGGVRKPRSKRRSR